MTLRNVGGTVRSGRSGPLAQPSERRNTMVAVFLAQLSDQLSNVVSNLGSLLAGIL
jgi:hypothetical protein